MKIKAKNSGQIVLFYASISLLVFISLFKDAHAYGPGARFSKDPVSYRARYLIFIFKSREK